MSIMCSSVILMILISSINALFDCSSDGIFYDISMMSK